MTDFHSLVANLRRPRLLIRAARCGVDGYRRDKDLRRLIPQSGVARPEQVMTHLMDEEERLEQSRIGGCASYSLARHVEVMIALMCEIRLLPVGARP